LPLHTTTLELYIHEDSEIIDITRQIQEELSGSPFNDGMLTVFVPGSNGGVMTLEMEPDLERDLEKAFERWASEMASRRVGLSRHGGNGRRGALAALVGPSLSVPFRDGLLDLGSRQQIAFVDFDSRPRKRVLILQIMGE